MKQPDQYKSKTQLKRDFQALHVLAETLIGLSESQVMNLPASPRLREAIELAQRQSKGALQRQLRFIARLLTDEDLAVIRDYIERIGREHQQQVRRFHRIEQWRDALIAGEDAAFSEVTARYANIDRQRLRQLVKAAEKERLLDQPPKAARRLFRYLSELESMLDG